MFKPYLGTCLVAVLIMAGHAGAQTPLSQQPPAGVGSSMIGSGTKGQLFLEHRQPDQFRSTNLRGTRIYGASNENIGAINDVLISQSGQVAAVIIGVGGFLGIGEKDVAVPMSMLLFQPGAVAANSEVAPLAEGSPNPSPPAADVEPGAPAAALPSGTSAAARHDNGIPDRLILKMTKEQLQNAPAFQDTVSDRTLSSENPAPTAPTATQRP